MSTEQKYLEKIVKTEKEIDLAISNVAKILNDKYKNKTVIFLVVMKGGSFLANDLAKKCTFDIKFDYVFSKSYYLSKKLSSPKITYLKTLDIKGYDVLLIDDLIDKGDTINEISKVIIKNKPLSIGVVALYSKNPPLKTKMDNYFCFSEKPPGFLLGYGLDYDEKYRNLNYIGIIKWNEMKE